MKIVDDTKLLGLAAPTEIKLAVATLINNLVGGTATAADANAQLNQAMEEQDVVIRTGQRISASASITGAGLSTLQMFADIAGNPVAATASAKLSARAGWLGLLANSSILMYKATDPEQGLKQIKDSDIVGLFASVVAIGAGTVAAPAAGIALGITAAGLTFASIAWSDSPSLQDHLDSLRALFAPYFNALSESDRLAFTNSLSATLENAFTGGMIVPRLNESGLISDYAVEVPVGIDETPGGNVYRFASGTTFYEGNNSPVTDKLLAANGITPTGTWLIRDGNSPVQAQFCSYSDESWSHSCAGIDGPIGAAFVKGNGLGYTITGNPEQTFVESDGNNDQLAISPGSAISINSTGDWITTDRSLISLRDGKSGYIVGQNNTIAAAADSFTGIFGTGSIVNMVSNSRSLVNLHNPKSSTSINGTGNTIGVLASDMNIHTSGNTFNFAATGFVTSITGNRNTINAAANSLTDISGVDNICAPGSYSGATINFAANSSGIVHGEGNTVGICGAGVSVTASGTTFNFSENGFSSTIGGNNNTINAGRDSFTALYGAGNVVNMVGNSNSLLNLYTANAHTTVNGGTGNTIGVLATGNSINSSGATLNFSATGFSTSISGDNNVINPARSSYTAVSGINNVLNPASNSGVKIDLTSNFSGRVNGSGNTIGICGSGISVNASGNTFNSSAGGFSTGIIGNSNIINLGPSSYTSVNGKDNVVNPPSNSGAKVDLAGYFSGSVNGSGNTIGICGNGINVNASGNTLNSAAPGFNTIVRGDRNTIHAAASSLTEVFGNANVVSMAPNSGATVNLHTANASNTVVGVGNTVGILASGITVNASNQTFNFSATGFTASISGNDNSIKPAPYSLTEVSGTRNSVRPGDTSGATVNFNSNATGAVYGSGNTIGICGSGIAVATSGNTVNTIDGAQFNLSGGNDSVHLNGPCYLGLLGGSGYSITSQGSTIQSLPNTSFTLAGAGNVLQLDANNSLSISGNDNAVYAGTHSFVMNQGINNTVHTNDSVVILGRESLNQTNYVMGNGNTIDASALATSEWRDQTTIVIRGTGNTIYGNSNTMIDLRDYKGNNVIGSNVSVMSNSNTQYTRNGAPSYAGTYGPLNPAAPSNTQINFPGYTPSGSSARTEDGGVTNWGKDPALNMPLYDQLLDEPVLNIDVWMTPDGGRPR